MDSARSSETDGGTGTGVGRETVDLRDDGGRMGLGMDWWERPGLQAGEQTRKQPGFVLAELVLGCGAVLIKLDHDITATGVSILWPV